MSNLLSPVDGFTPGGTAPLNLVSRQRLDQLGEHAQNNVLSTQLAGSKLSQFYQNILLLVQVHSSNTLQDIVLKTSTEAVDVFVRKVRELDSSDSLKQYASSLGDRFEQLKKMVHNHSDVSTNSMNQPETWHRILSQLELFWQEVNTFSQTVHTAALDLKKAKPYIINKQQKALEQQDVVVVSNVSIFEIIDYEMQRMGSLDTLKNCWTLLQDRFRAVFSAHKYLNRLDEKRMLRHKAAAKPGNGNADDWTLLDDVARAQYASMPPASVADLEHDLGVILEEFYNLNETTIKKMAPVSPLRQFCPPFCAKNYNLKNIYANSLMTGGNQINLIVGGPSRGAGGEHSFSMPFHDLHFEPGGSMSLVVPPNKFLRGGRAPKRSYRVTAPDSSSEDDDVDDGDDYEGDDESGAPKRARFEPKISLNDVQNRLPPARPRTMETLVRDTPTQSILDVLQRINTTIAMIQRADYSDFHSNLLAIANNFDMLMALENVFTPTSGHKPLAVTSEMLEEFLSVFDTLVAKNMSLNEVARNAFLPTRDALNQAHATMLSDFGQVDQKFLMLPAKLRYTKHYGVVFNFWRINSIIQQVVRSIFVEKSVFKNENTAFSMGKLNQDSTNFETQAEEGRLITLSDTEESRTAVEAFKRALRLEVYRRQSKFLKTSIAAAKDAADTFIAEYKRIERDFNNVLKMKTFLENIFKNNSCGSVSKNIGPHVGADKKNWAYTADLDQSFAEILANINNQSIAKNSLETIFDQISVATLQKPQAICFFQNVFSQQAALKTSTQNFKNFAAAASALIKLKSMLTGFPIEFFLDQNSQPTYKISEAALDVAKKLERMANSLDRLGVNTFEKRFSTPIVGAPPEDINKNIVEAFVQQGYNEFLKSPFSMNLYFMGPSGSGKTFSQYGTLDTSGPNSVLGLDQKFLALPKVSVAFKDYYYMAFYAHETFLASLSQPTFVHYTLNNDGDIQQNRTSQKQFEPITNKNLTNIRSLIEHVRAENKFVRKTAENEGGSSRAFLVMSVQQEGQIFKNMIDTPGYEPVTNPSFANPFIFIHDFVVTLARGIPKNLTQQDWLKTLVNSICNSLTQMVPDDFRMNTQVPLPSSGTFLETGIEHCTFSEFINDTICSVDIKVQHKILSRESNFTINETVVNYEKSGNVYVTFPGGTLIVTTTTNNNPDKKAFTLIEAVAPNASFDTNTMHVELSDRFPPQSASFSFKVFKNSKQNLFLEYRGAVIAFCTWIIFQKIFGNTKSLTNTIDTVFLEKIVPQNLRNAVRQTLEAIFINQFNFWAQQATLKNNNTSLVEYLKGDSAGREVARLKTTIGDLYAEYLYLTADVTFTAQTNLLAVFPRHTYAQQILPWQNAYEQTNWSDFGLTIEFKNDFRKWDLGRALEAYDQHSKLYHPYMPLGDLSAFDKNFITSGKNLFVTLLNSNKIRTYPSFFDINLEKLNPLAEEAPLGFDNL